MFMEQEKKDEIKRKLEKITRIERRYFMDWLMDNYPIYYIRQDNHSIMMAIDYSGAKYKKINDFLNNITDHSKWEIDENIYIKAEKDGLFIIPDTNELISELTEKENNYFIHLLKEKFPIYNEFESMDYLKLTNSFDKEGYPKYIEVLEILKEIKKINI